MPPHPQRILIVGGGPAGATTAYWLSKAGHSITIAERSSQKFAYGQGIDITGPGIRIVSEMGLLDTIKSQTTGEGGFALLNDESKPVAVLGAGKGFTLTQEIEILRGDLTQILADAAGASERVRYRYGCTVTELRQSSDRVSVVLSDNPTGEAEDFDLVVGADGLRSRVRQLGFDRTLTGGCYKELNQYCAFFSMDAEDDDVPNARVQHSTLGRAILVRPMKVVGNERSSCYILYTATSAQMKEVLEKGVEKQKEALAEVFGDFPGHLGRRAVKGMWDAKDFYFCDITQIKLPKWSSGRCVLVGDAGYAPSPLTGQGTVLALLGAYVLAGELARSPDDYAAAFEKYEERLRGFVEKAQYIPFNGALPKFANPQTYVGVCILRFVVWLVAFTGVYKLFDTKGGTKFDFPDYDFEGVEG